MSWDLSGVTEQGGTVNSGEYTVRCKKAEVKNTQSGGEMIRCLFETEKGEAIWHNFNTKNKTPKAVEIGLGQLKKFMAVSGKADPNKLDNVTDLEGLRCNVKVKIESDDTYGDRAVISAFKPAPEKGNGFI